MTDPLARRDPLRLAPDPSRVIAQLFVPGHALAGEHEGRASGVVEHVLALDDDEVTATLADVTARFGGRHRDLAGTFRHHADRIANRLAPGTELSAERRLLLGATFTHEYAVEAAALCNPSTVAAPDQTGAAPGALRFVMSVRQIGEGHRSSIGFRTGVVDRHGAVTIDDPGPFTTAGTVEPGPLDADLFRSLAHDGDSEATGWVLDGLGDRFTGRSSTPASPSSRPSATPAATSAETAHRLRQLAGRSLRRAVPVAVHARRAGARPGDERRVQRHGGRPVRALRRRRRHRHLLRDVHRLRRRRHHPAAARRPPTSCRSRRRRCSAPPPPTRAWRCSPARSTAGSSPCRATTAHQRRRLLRRHPPLADGHPARRPHRGLGGGAGRQLRLADRDRRRLARAHPRRRTDAHVLDRRAAPRPRRPDDRDRPDPATAADAAARRAGRLRAQRRVLLRRPAPRRRAARPVRHRRRQHRLRHRRDRRAPRRHGC